MSRAAAALFDSLFIAIELVMLAAIISTLARRRVKRWILAASLAAAAVSLHVLITWCGGMALPKLCISVAGMAAWSMACFRIGPVKCIFIVLFCLAYYTLADMALIIVYTAASGINVPRFMDDMYSYVSFNVLAKLIELFGAAALCVWLKHRLNDVYAGSRNWLRTLIYPASAAIIGVCMVRIATYSPGSSEDVFICMVIVLVTDLVSLFLTNLLERQQMELYKADILRAGVKSEQENVRTWQEAYSQQRKLTHEYDNQLAAIRGMIEDGRGAGEVIDYIDQLRDMPDSAGHFVSTNRAAADAVINRKLALAEGQDIDFRLQLDDLSAVALPDYALVSVLANIIDNAIEAAGAVEDRDSRYISLKIKVIDEVTYINIENYTAAPVLIKNNRVVTSGKEPGKHGCGLLNVGAIVSRYGGFYTIRYDGDRHMFALSIQV